MDEVTVFVYGSLKSGCSNHEHLEGCRAIGPARTAPQYTLVDCGAWPALKPGGEDAIPGELYAVPRDLMPRLDAFEGVPRLFIRRPLVLDDGAVVEAWFRPDAVGPTISQWPP